jgi:hypothetical protein
MALHLIAISTVQFMKSVRMMRVFSRSAFFPAYARINFFCGPAILRSMQRLEGRLTTDHRISACRRISPTAVRVCVRAGSAATATQ